ncbi:unnamed protein product [Lampetra planeri]
MDNSEQQRRVQLGRVQTADSVEQRSPKKLQFVMPPGQMQLDPAALEQVRRRLEHGCKGGTGEMLTGARVAQIRRRRPTPAKLVVMNEQASQPELRHALELCCTEQQLSGAGTDGAAKDGPNGVAAGAEVTWDAGGEVARVAGLNSDSETPALAQSPGDVDKEEPETLPSVEEAPRKPRRKDTPVYQVPPLALGAGRVQRRPRDVQQQQQQPVPAMPEEEWAEELLVSEETLLSAKVNVQPSVPS